ncbi:hypothetical protein L218DRAFT_1004310 [Marasmius fiardii PR-910]|nr:hypothetical protein L218DRAFT_1004310 [Marasmius fiardii PR-910]
MIPTTTTSVLSLGLPPLSNNAPFTINIDFTCALFALEVSGKRVVTAPQSERGKRVETTSERARPRLHRILNLPSTPCSNPSSLSSPNAPTLTTTLTVLTETSLTPDANKENEAPPLCYGASTRSLEYTEYGASSTDKLSEKLKKQMFSNVQAALPRLQRRRPLGGMVTSTLSAEQRVIRRPAPKPNTNIPRFTNPFNGNIPVPAPLDTFSDAPNVPRLFPSTSNTRITVTAPRRRENTSLSPLQLHHSNVGLATVVSTTYDSDEIVELHRRRIYPSSTEPESEWCRGETVVRVRRRDLHPYDTVTPTIKTSTVEIVSPRPVGVHRYRDTRKWLQTLSRELATDEPWGC